MIEMRYRVKDLVNYPERPAKDYVDRSGRRRRLSYKPVSKGLLNIAESTFWKMIRRGDFPEPTYLTASMPTWAESQIKEWLEQKEIKAACHRQAACVYNIKIIKNFTIHVINNILKIHKYY